MSSGSSCWCGNTALEAFSSDYLRCPACETLIVTRMPRPDELLVKNDERDYYGKHYFDTIAELHGLPPLSARARADLPERCLHWLRGLLRYCSPPARILELGSAHGGYVAMMRWAGFDATGLDLSPEIVTEARERFGVPVLEGPLESQDIEPGSLDAIVLMDVLEHLGNPKETLRHCIRLLKPSGLMFLQTPQYREGKSFEQMSQEDDPFLRMLTPDQHLYLFSRSSVKQLFRELRVEHVNFEPAIFSSYDMALVSSRVPPVSRPESEIVAGLESSPSGRSVLALYDLHSHNRELTGRLRESEADRAVRLENVLKLERTLAEQATAHAADAAAQAATIKDLTARLKDSEADRDVRLENNLKLEKMLAEQAASNWTNLEARAATIDELTTRLKDSDADRAVRLENIIKLEKMLAVQGEKHSADWAGHTAAVDDLTARLRNSETDRALRMENGLKLEKMLADQAAAHTAQIAEAAAAIDRLTEHSKELLGRVGLREEQILAQSGELRELTAGLRGARRTFSQKTASLTTIYQNFRKENAAQKLIIEAQQHRLARADSLLGRMRESHVYRLMRRAGLWGWLDSNASQPTECQPSVLIGRYSDLRRVVVDLTPVLPGGGNGGAKVMTVELIRHLCRFAPDCDFILLTSEVSHDELATLDALNVSRLCINPPDAAMELTGNGSLVRRLGADLLFCPFTAPFYFDPAVATVSVIYDLQHVYYPEFFDVTEIEERNRNLNHAIQSANRIICISEFVRTTVLEKTTASADRVETIHILLPHRFGMPSPSLCLSVLEDLSLVSGQFLLYPANFWPHKNHELLLTAFGIYLARDPGSKMKLVLTGTPGERQDFLKGAARAMGLSKAVQFPGYLPDEKLNALYHSCTALIFPSLFEGFGMPLLEAMGAGCPILCSNTTSLPEVAGNAALLFDPRKPAEIADAIARIANDLDLRRDLAAKSGQRLEAFGGPKDMAASYLATFRRAVQELALTSPGVYGVFEDGWVGEHFTISFGPGIEGRRIQVALQLPEWVSIPTMSILLETAGTAAQSRTLTGGQTEMIEVAIGCDAGSLRFHCSPSFRPCQCGLGEDQRYLTCKLARVEIITPDGVSAALKSIHHGA